MKSSALLIAFLISITLFSPGFKCGYQPLECDKYVNDTFNLPLAINGNAQSIGVLDTVWQYFNLPDTFTTYKGNKVNYSTDSYNITYQPYKVVQSGNIYELEMANIQFNPFVSFGTINTYYQGFNFYSLKTPTGHSFKGGIIAGYPGLYLVKTNIGNYYGSNSVSTHPQNDYCTNYLGLCYIPEAAQSKHLWPSPSQTALNLKNSNNLPIVKLADKNYFMIKVQ